MRVLGYCTRCHRVRYINATSSGMVALAAKSIPHGLCTQCEREAEEERQAVQDRVRRRTHD